MRGIRLFIETIQSILLVFIASGKGNYTRTAAAVYLNAEVNKSRSEEIAARLKMGIDCISRAGNTSGGPPLWRQNKVKKMYNFAKFSTFKVLRPEKQNIFARLRYTCRIRRIFYLWKIFLKKQKSGANRFCLHALYSETLGKALTHSYIDTSSGNY